MADLSIGYNLGGLLFALSGQPVLIAFSVALVGASGMFRYPAQMSMIIESIKPQNPALVGAAIAFIQGTASISALGIPPLFSYFTNVFGMDRAFVIFFSINIIGIIFAFFLKETNS